MASGKHQINSTAERYLTIIGWCAVGLLFFGSVGLLVAVRLS